MTDYLMLAGLKPPPPVLFGGGLNRQQQTESRRMKVYLMLSKDKSTTFNELISKVDCSDTALRSDLASLVKRGMAVREVIRVDKSKVYLWRRASV